MQKMLISAGLTVLALTSSLTGARAGPPLELALIQKQMLAPVAQINRSCSAPIIYSGKPKVADPSNPNAVVTYLLSAKHCANDDGLIQDVYIPVYDNNRIVKEEVYKAVIDKKFVKHDLATYRLLDDKTVFTNVAQLADEDVELYEGEKVWTVGYSLGEVRTITDGLFGNRVSIPFPDPKKDMEYFRSTPQIAGGNSGGSLFHHNKETNSYEIIGTTSAAIGASDFVGYYVPIDVIHDFLSYALPDVADSSERITPGVH